jgi:hypothetical protein
MGSRFVGFPGVGAGLEAAGGPLGLASGVASGNPFSAASGLSNMASTAAPWLNGLVGGAGIPFWAGGLSAGSGAVGASLGALGGSFFPAAGGASAGAAGAAGAAGSGAAAMGLGGTLAGLGATFAPLLAVGSLGFMNRMHKDAQKVKKQTIESGQIRRGYAENMPRFLQAAEVARNLPTDPTQLRGALGTLETGLTGAPAIQQFIATRGQGGAKSKTKPADTSQAEALFRPAYTDTMLGWVQAMDQAARTGQLLPPGVQGQGANPGQPDLLWRTAMRDPRETLNQLIGGTTGAAHPIDPRTNQPLDVYSLGLDTSGIGPGNMTEWLRGQLGANIPNFGATPLGQMFASIPTQAVSPEMAALAQQYAAQRYPSPRDTATLMIPPPGVNGP